MLSSLPQGPVNLSTPTTTFSVATIIETLAEQDGHNVSCEGMDDDICFGLVISSDTSFRQFLSAHAGPYNFRVVDGDPIRVVRRAINNNLVIDFSLVQADLVTQNGAAAITFERIDPASLPREVELQYQDPDRDFAVNTQYGRNDGAGGAPATKVKDVTFRNRVKGGAGAKTKLRLSAAINFIIDAATARTMAFDYLFRQYAEQLKMTFETTNLQIEPADTFSLTCDQGTFTGIVDTSTITKTRTNMIAATILLTSGGVTAAAGGVSVSGGQASSGPGVIGPTDEFAAWLLTKQ